MTQFPVLEALACMVCGVILLFSLPTDVTLLVVFLYSLELFGITPALETAELFRHLRVAELRPPVDGRSIIHEQSSSDRNRMASSWLTQS
jgi:hypothetical protein